MATESNTSDTVPNHAFVANLPQVSDSILTSPSFVLNNSTPWLRFRHSYESETGFDGGVLELSTNGSAFADVIAAGGSFIEGGYVTALQSGGGNPISGRQAWTGDSNGYITTTVQLPASALGQNNVLRWRFASDDSVAAIGWRIDTITLESIPTEDFGDAPATYPVTLASNGARHTVGALRLGATVDTENDAVASSNALGDGTDEDGVVISGGFVPGKPKNITVTASQAGGLLNAWIDWNADGDWADTNERIFTNRALVVGANLLTINVPTGLSSATTFARFRLSTTPGLGVTGLATNGEVEDYQVSINASADWSPLGPFGATNGQVENIPNRTVVGAIHTVLAHPTNADILYVGSVNGGVWKTVNATASQPNWIPLTDAMPSQSIGALAFDLADPTFNTLYAGVGLYSSYGQLGNTRIGLMRSTNGGQTWQVVDGGGLLQGKNISGIYANGNTVAVSVNVANNFSFPNIGIFRSTDRGVSFTQITSGDGTATGLPGGVTYDLVYDPIAPTTLYTATVFSPLVGGARRRLQIHRYWRHLDSRQFSSHEQPDYRQHKQPRVGYRTKQRSLCCNHQRGSHGWPFPFSGQCATWTQMDSPKTNENGVDVGLNPSGGKGPQSGAPEAIAGGQGNIHFSIVADPNDPNIVYVGGDRQPRTNGDTGGFPNSIGAIDFSGRLFRGDASRPAGSQFVHLTHRNNVAALPGGGTASSSSPHADSREMTFNAIGELIEVDDGGIYRRTSPRTNTGDWFSLIGDLQVTEAHDVAWDALTDTAMTGNQDTGTTLQTRPEPSYGNRYQLPMGDVAVDNIELAGSNRSVRYSSFQNLGGFRRTIWDSSGALIGTTFPALTPTGGAPSIARTFRTPIETNKVAGRRLIILGSNGLYESEDAGSTVRRIGTVGSSSITANALAYGGVRDNVVNPNVIWAGIGSDVFVRTSGTGNISAVPSDPTTGAIRDLAVNSRDWANAFVVTSNQVFQTVNTGSSWTDITEPDCLQV